MGNIVDLRPISQLVAHFRSNSKYVIEAKIVWEKKQEKRRVVDTDIERPSQGGKRGDAYAPLDDAVTCKSSDIHFDRLRYASWIAKCNRVPRHCSTRRRICIIDAGPTH